MVNPLKNVAITVKRPPTLLKTAQKNQNKILNKSHKTPSNKMQIQQHMLKLPKIVT